MEERGLSCSMLHQAKRLKRNRPSFSLMKRLAKIRSVRGCIFVKGCIFEKQGPRRVDSVLPQTRSDGEHVWGWKSVVERGLKVDRHELFLNSMAVSYQGKHACVFSASSHGREVCKGGSGKCNTITVSYPCAHSASKVAYQRSPTHSSTSTDLIVHNLKF